ncbi:MAG: VOC family protein [Candidatus Thiodiazotropha sp. (ex Dulcina madagascariensis)]|nr:VOC family protein [Candidatus Thiodiazotropha sp. (ex Dulcina madagascariensis)]MCU7924940.1 VOC family protein [Candidatus Thiodiazotropha sp. (ex Dulcina madagascariensis)]
MQPRINLITLGVDDLPRSIAFYEALDLPRYAFDSDAVAFFELQGSWLALYPREALADDAGVPADGSGFRGFTLAHNVTSREAVERVMREALDAGARQVKPVQETFWGGYSGYFADPDGFLWEVAHVPQFWIGPGDGGEA